MNAKTQKLIELDKQYLWHPFTQMADWLASKPVVIESGEGFYLTDTEGRRYIDGVSSLWCNVHGHRVKKIDDAIAAQLDKIAHSTLLGLGQTASIELAEKLVQISPEGLEKVFYSDSGATAVEIAIKIAYQYWQNIGQTKKIKFISLKEAYHGDTVGSVSVGGMDLFHGIFKSLLFETFYVPSPHPYRFDGTEKECTEYSLAKMEALLKEHAGQIAGIVVEPLVQGAAGILVHPKGFLKGVEALSRKYDTLLIVDEVATGFGRTGRMFACEHEAVRPDLMCVAKGISAGYLPLAATLATQTIFDAFLVAGDIHKTFYHGHTYTGNALGCAAALASLELFEENDILGTLPEKIRLIADYFERFEKLPYVGDCRQCGMVGGIELVADKETKEPFLFEQKIGAKVCAAMRPKGAMMRPLGNVVVLMPAVGMDMETLQKLMDIIENTLKHDLPKLTCHTGLDSASK
ncbi:MAG: adenosylmethionine--8-amino-7-oxononanoate transaminase [Phycisphaerae bacterium]|nr:adenosylmethionine--8-amino-7-oxononanoate transaminase [Phycisphaerae bacterium]